MKKLSIIGVLLLGVLLIAGMTVEDKFTLKIYQWMGIDSDEPFAVDMLKPKDMFNLEIGNEGGKIYIQQRQGIERILADDDDSLGDEIRAIQIVQMDGDSERVVVYTNNNFKVWQTTGNDNTWYDCNGGTGTVATDTFNNFTVFKDTLIFACGDSVHLYTATSGSSPSFLQVRSDSGWHWNRTFLHQDRIYGYGTHADNNNQFAWMPEFDINFNRQHYDSMVALEAAGSAFIDQDAGDYLTNMVPMGEHIMAYMSRTIYKVLIGPLDNKPVEIVRFAENVGAYGYDAVHRWNNLHYFVAEDGVYENNGSSVRKISEPLDFWFKDSLVHSTGQAKVFKLAVYDNKLFVSLPFKLAGNENRAGGFRTFVYDLDMKIWAKWRLNPHDGRDPRETHWLLRYEYSPFSALALTGNQYLKQRLLIIRDSSMAATGTKDIFHLFPSDNFLSDDGDTLIGSGGTYAMSYYETPLTPITDMWKRKRIERVVIYGEATVSASDSAIGTVLYVNTEAGAVDSVYFSITESPFLINKRFSNNAVGDLIGIRLEMRDSNRVKINALELVGMEVGMGNETE